jgi:hypothetical protein
MIKLTFKIGIPEEGDPVLKGGNDKADPGDPLPNKAELEVVEKIKASMVDIISQEVGSRPTKYTVINKGVKTVVEGDGL